MPGEHAPSVVKQGTGGTRGVVAVVAARRDAGLAAIAALEAHEAEAGNCCWGRHDSRGGWEGGLNLFGAT